MLNFDHTNFRASGTIFYYLLSIMPPAIDVLVRVRELTRIPSAEKIREVMSREVIGFLAPKKILWYGSNVKLFLHLSKPPMSPYSHKITHCCTKSGLRILRSRNIAECTAQYVSVLVCLSLSEEFLQIIGTIMGYPRVFTRPC